MSRFMQPHSVRQEPKRFRSHGHDRNRAGHNAPAVGGSENGGVRPTVVIVDDHEDFRASAALLEADGFGWWARLPTPRRR